MSLILTFSWVWSWQLLSSRSAMVFLNHYFSPLCTTLHPHPVCVARWGYSVPFLIYYLTNSHSLSHFHWRHTKYQSFFYLCPDVFNTSAADPPNTFTLTMPNLLGQIVLPLPNILLLLTVAFLLHLRPVEFSLNDLF